MEWFFKHIIQVITGIILTCLGYIFGRKKQIDEIVLKEKVVLLQKMCSKLEEVHEGYIQLYEFWQKNFGHTEFYKAIEGFKKRYIYDEDRKMIEKLIMKESELYDLYKKSIVFIKPSFRKKLKKYLELGKFSYQHDNIGFHNTYYENFFKNLLKKHDQRLKLFEELEKEFHKII